MEYVFYMWSFFGFIGFCWGAVLLGQVAALKKEVEELRAMIESDREGKG